MNNSKNNLVNSSVFLSIDVTCIPDVTRWLRQYGQCIDFNTSYREIAASHRIPEDVAAEIGASDLPFFRIPLSEIRNRVRSTGIEFDDVAYERYIRVSIGIAGLSLDVIPDYDARATCYSIPLIKSLITINNLPPTAIFEFAEYTIGSVTTIIFKITGVDMYYDYSQQPWMYPVKNPI